MTAPVSIRALLLASLALASASTLRAQTGASAGTSVARAVDSMVFKAHLEFLADDALEGRAPGTRGGQLAAEIHRDPVRAPRPGAGGRQRQLLPARADHRAHARADPRGGGARPTPLAWKNDYVLWSMRNDSLVNVQGDLVFVGYGIVAPEQRLERLRRAGREGQDRRGRW